MELIVVIAIIGILAAVLIPSITGYITKAKISKHEQEAAAINTMLTAESIFDNVSYYEPYELETLLNKLGYSFSTSVEGYAFWYNTAENKVVYKKIDEGVSAATYSSYTGIECIMGGTMCYIDQADNGIRNAIDRIRFLTQESNGETYEQKYNNMKTGFTNAVLDNSLKDNTKLSNPVLSTIKNNLNKFNPASGGLYIDDSYMYGNFDHAITGVVFTPEIRTIPNPILSATQSLRFVKDLEINIPSTVQFISAGALNNVVIVENVTEGKPGGDIDILASPITLRVSSNVHFAGNISHNLTKISITPSIVYQQLLGTEINYQVVKINNSASDLDDSGEYYSSIVTGMNVIDSSLNEVGYKYTLRPIIKLNRSGQLSFADLLSVDIRSKIYDNVVIYTAVAVDKELNGYKLGNVGHILDVNYSVSKTYHYAFNALGEIKSTRIVVADPLQGYNFSNFKDITVKVKFNDNTTDNTTESVLTKVAKKNTSDLPTLAAFEGDYLLELNGNVSVTVKEISVFATVNGIKNVLVFKKIL